MHPSAPFLGSDRYDKPGIDKPRLSAREMENTLNLETGAVEEKTKP